MKTPRAGGCRVVRKTLEFSDFLNIYMVSAPSASDFLEFFGIHNAS